jgi:hypothetical protein
MKRVGFLGAYSIDNAGDALIGLATRQAIRARVPDLDARTYAPAFPQPFWGHDFSRARGIDGEIVPVPAGEEMDWARDLDALIVGGGGIVNLDPSFRPFLLGRPERWDPALPAAWNAVCSQNTAWYAGGFEAAYQAVRRCCEALRYVSVRNRTTVTFLRRCGYAGPVELVPDPTFALALPDGADAAVDALLAEHGVADAPARIGVSIGNAIADPRAADFFRDLFASLERLGRAGATLVLFPFGHLRGDLECLELAAARLPGATVVRRRLSAPEAWRLVGRMSFTVVTRYHAMLAALTQEVPFVVLDEYLSDDVASSKIRELIAEHGLEPLYLCPFLSRRPSWKLEDLFHARAAISFATTLAGARQRLARHYDEMIAALDL